MVILFLIFLGNLQTVLIVAALTSSAHGVGGQLGQSHGLGSRTPAWPRELPCLATALLPRVQSEPWHLPGQHRAEVGMQPFCWAWLHFLWGTVWSMPSRGAHLLLYHKPCGWQGLGAPAGCQAWASEVGELSSGHWFTRDLPAPCNIKQWKLSQRSPSQL